MKIKYNNLQLLIKFTRIQQNMFKKNLQIKSIIQYTHSKNSIIIYTPSKYKNKPLT